MNHTLKLLSGGLNIKDILQIENKSEKTIRNRISVAILLNLVNKFRKEFFLTELGLQFVKAYENISDRLSQKQIEILSDFIKWNPFYSNITYTVFSLIETIFTLSKNNYPVPKNLPREYFVKSVGKISTWKTERSKETASYK